MTKKFKVSKTNVLAETVSQYNFNAVKCYDDTTGRFIVELRRSSLDDIETNSNLKEAVLSYENRI